MLFRSPHSIICSQQGLHPVMLQPDMPHHTITLICRKSGYKSPACTAFGVLATLWCHNRPGASKSALAEFGADFDSLLEESTSNE